MECATSPRGSSIITEKSRMHRHTRRTARGAGRRWERNVIAFRHFALAVLILSVCSAISFGQEFTGHVTDTTGAVVPGAIITVHNLLTNQDIRTKTDGAGDYTAPYLKPGVYSVRAERQGFETQLRTNIRLAADATVGVNFVLTVGSVQETVTVQANQELLDTENANNNETFTSKDVSEIPNNGRDVNMTATLSTSVNFFDVNDGSPTGTESGTSNFGGGWFTMSVNGGQFGGAITLMDGLPNDSTAGSGPQLAQTVTSAPMEAVEDFKVIANAYDARYGNGSGGGFDTVIKTGTNDLHGNVYEILRRTWMNANPWLTDYYLNTPSAAEFAAPESSENWDGFAIDGPVVIPHVYNGKNKTFFFLQYDDRGQKVPGTSTDSVPDCTTWNSTGQPCNYADPASMGDFSNLYGLGPNGGPVPITLYDPLSGTPTNRNPFPNNTIPVCVGNTGLGPTGGACINPVALKMLSFFPKPNVAAPAGVNPYNDNYFVSWTSNAVTRNIMGKFDQEIGPRDRVSFLGSLSTQANSFANLFGGTFFPNSAGSGEGGDNRGWSVVPEWIHTFGPHLVLDLKGSAGYADTEQHYTPTGFNLSALGGAWGGYAPQLGVFGTMFPNINFTADGFSSLGASLPPNLLSGTTVNLLPTLTWVKGAHTINAGFDYRYRMEGFIGVPGGQGFQSPNFNVSNGWTQQNYQNSGLAFQGFDLASLMIGYADTGGVNPVVNRTYSNSYYSPFFQDDWKVTRKLTLNIGVRYDYSPAPLSRNNEQNYAFNTSAINPVTSQVNTSELLYNAPITGGFTFAGVDGNPQRAIYTQKTGLQPRFGAAYLLTPKTVLRGGFGEMLTGPLLTYSSLVQDGLVGFSSATAYISTLDNFQTPNPNASMTNPFSNGVTPISGASQGLLTDLGQGASFFDPHFKSTSYWDFSFGIQRQLTTHDIVQISYVGSKTYNLTPYNVTGHQGNDINMISPGWQQQCDQGFGGDPTICNNDLVGNPFYNVGAFQYATAFSNAAPQISYGQLTRPLPAFGDIYEVVNNGRSWYNSMQTSFRHQWNNALTLDAGWTWQKTMDAGGWADQRYGLAERVVDPIDMTHKITITGVWDLPVGRGHAFLSNDNRLVDSLIGGWELGSGYVFSTGMPVQIGGVDMSGYAKTPLQGKGTLFVRRFSPCSLQWVQGSSGSWSLQPVTGYVYSGTCNQYDFTMQPQYGISPNLEYTGVRSNPLYTFDVNLSKYYALAESVKLQLRMNAFNVLNHPEFGTTPYEFDTGVTDPTFGTYSPLAGANTPRNLELQFRLLW